MLNSNLITNVYLIERSISARRAGILHGVVHSLVVFDCLREHGVPWLTYVFGRVNYDIWCVSSLALPVRLVVYRSIWIYFLVVCGQVALKKQRVVNFNESARAI